MRYKLEHKSATRDRILEAAARLFRRHGFSGVGIDTIMAESGMTRGGFYGHFASKDALFEAVLRREADFVVRMKRRTGKTKHELTAGAVEVVRGYLAPKNRERIANGCVMASLSLDAARASDGAKQAFADTSRDLVDEFCRGLPRAQPFDPRALVSLVLCVGGVVVSRAIGDRRLADAVSRACQHAVEQALQS